MKNSPYLDRPLRTHMETRLSQPLFGLFHLLFGAAKLPAPTAVDRPIFVCLKPNEQVVDGIKVAVSLAYVCRAAKINDRSDVQYLWRKERPVIAKRRASPDVLL